MMNLNNQTGKVMIAGYNTGRHVGINTQYKMFAPRFGFAYQLCRQHGAARRLRHFLQRPGLGRRAVPDASLSSVRRVRRGYGERAFAELSEGAEWSPAGSVDGFRDGLE